VDLAAAPAEMDTHPAASQADLPDLQEVAASLADLPEEVASLVDLPDHPEVAGSQASHLSVGADTLMQDS
jgi:hypothetical protein